MEKNYAMIYQRKGMIHSRCNNDAGSLQPQIRKERWNKIYHRPSEAGVLEESNTRVDIK
ncbi:hypothetical protein OIU77_030902 [Salix suchowensis]|uniref:Uncharacterized protein n=1 Tax=Salix suchowensis TaxID=1278906 RepID=A0ABQ9BDV2_9ROSI|nr:hypothetical protein OIU77_030902 [Salix suchowensis]